MRYLTVLDLYDLNIIDYNGEKLLLLETDDEGLTILEKTVEKSDGEYIDKSADVYFEQRWRVDVLPGSNFEKTFTTHRKIIVHYGKYSKLLEEQEKIYREIFFKNREDNNELGDDFNESF